jgi:hypothetical protein
MFASWARVSAICFHAILQLGKAFSGPKVEDTNYVKAKLVLQTTGFPVSSRGPQAYLRHCHLGRVSGASLCPFVALLLRHACGMQQYEKRLKKAQLTDKTIMLWNER